MKFVLKVLISTSFILPAVLPAAAATITLDENGNGNINGTALPFITTGTNPNVPFQSPVLVYTLPFSGVQGAVQLLEPESGNIPGDVLQFNGDGTVIYFSRPDGDATAAERYFPPIPPFPVPNTVQIVEGGTLTNESTFYTPSAGQPGYDVSNPTYNFIGDTPAAVATPEPSSFALLALSGLGVVGLKLRKRRNPA